MVRTLEKIVVGDVVVFDPEIHAPAITWRDVLDKLEMMTNQELDQECLVTNANVAGMIETHSSKVHCPVVGLFVIPEQAGPSKLRENVPQAHPGQLVLLAATSAYKYLSHADAKKYQTE